MSNIIDFVFQSSLEGKQAETKLAVAPQGWEGTVKHMKEHKEIDNPWALSWYMKNKGAEPHYTEKGTKKKKFK